VVDPEEAGSSIASEHVVSHRSGRRCRGRR
jgi:hypothetical protein